MNSKAPKNKAIFLDRDGVINIDKQYVSKIKDFQFKNGIFELLKYLQKLGYKLIVVTNQSGIGRGYYSQKDFEILTRWKIEELKKRGIVIDDVFFCPHAPELLCECRKPKAKMLLDAQKKFNIDLKNSWMIGDKKSDIEAGKNAGVGKTILVLGHSMTRNENANADYSVSEISEIAKLIKD